MKLPVSITEVLLFLILYILVITYNYKNTARIEPILHYVIVFVIVFGASIVAYYALNLLVMAGFTVTGLDFWGQR